MFHMWCVLLTPMPRLNSMSGGLRVASQFTRLHRPILTYIYILTYIMLTNESTFQSVKIILPLTTGSLTTWHRIVFQWTYCTYTGDYKQSMFTNSKLIQQCRHLATLAWVAEDCNLAVTRPARADTVTKSSRP